MQHHGKKQYFLDVMENALKVYTSKLKNGEESMEKCITKLNAIIENCKPIQ